AREASALVEAQGWLERFARPRLEPERPHTPYARLAHQVREERAADPPPEERVGDAHRLDLSALGVELFERAAARDLGADPDRPEGHAGLAQLVHVEGVHGARRRVLVHS